MTEPASGTAALTERVESVIGDVNGRYVEDRARWEWLEEIRRRDSAPFVEIKDREITSLVAPKYKFLDKVILPLYVKGKVRDTALAGQVLGMLWDGVEWEYTFFTDLNIPTTAKEDELLPQKPERVRTLVTYVHQGQWVFDDAALGIEKEPFVSGIDLMIDRMTVLIPDAHRGFRLQFSDYPFEGFRARLIWLRVENGGNWYDSPHYETEGWLCPVLYRYFDEAPKELFVRALPL